MAASPMPAVPDPAELERMFCALVDGVMSPDDFSLLENLLANDRGVRDQYRDFMRVEYLLSWEIGYGIDPSPDAPFPARAPRAGSSVNWTQAIRGRAGAWLPPLVLAGSVLLAAVSAGMGMRSDWQRRSGGADAVLLTAEDAAHWQAEAAPRLNGPVPSGPLKLEAGSAQLTFSSGAVVAIRAPAQVEVLGRNRLFLRSGRITPFVPPQAKGFTVVSPGGEVVDFGTEFSIDVDATGKTDVFVIDGSVDVSGGHAAAAEPVRLTQGFASRISPAQRAPELTLVPLVVDHFDGEVGPLRRRDVDAGEGSRIMDGQLRIPIDGSRRPEPIARVALENDFSAVVGRRSVISFNATLPEEGTGDISQRWLALVIYEGDGAPPKGTWESSIASVLVSPRFTVGARVKGASIKKKRGFPRAGRGAGPHRVVVEIDDTPATRERLGGAGMSVTANGLEIVRDQPITLGAIPRLALHTHVDEACGGRGHALVDDFSVSVEADIPRGRDRAAGRSPMLRTPRDELVGGGHVLACRDDSGPCER